MWMVAPKRSEVPLTLATSGVDCSLKGLNMESLSEVVKLIVKESIDVVIDLAV